MIGKIDQATFNSAGFETIGEKASEHFEINLV
jgi:hypothetical protein